MADETTRLLLEVIGRDRGASRTLNKVGDAADDAADAVDGLTDSTDKSSKSTDGLGAKHRTLDQRIEHTRKTILDLAKAIEDSPDELPLFKQLGKEQSTLRRLERVKRLLPNDKDGETSAVQVSAGFFRRLTHSASQWSQRVATAAVSRIPTALGGALSALPPQAQTGIVAAIVAAIGAGSSLIAGALSALVTAGLGAGAIVGGLVLAARDSRVTSAATTLGQTVMRGLTKAAGVFVGPALRSIEILRSGFTGLMPDITRAFAAAAPYVDNLTRGVVGLVRNLMPGLVTAIERSGPVINALGRGLEQTGAALGQFFRDLSADAGGSQQALRDLFTLINTTVFVLGKMLGGLTTSYRVAAVLGRVMSGDVKGAITSIIDSQIAGATENSDYADTLMKIAQGAGEVAGALSDTKQVIGTTATAMQPSIDRTNLMAMSMMGAAEAAGSLAQALQTVNGDALDAREAEANYQQALDDATAALKENGETLDLNTAKGRANDAALRSIAQATFAKADADYRAKAATGDLNGAQQAANQTLERGRRAFIEAAEAMGMTRAQARRLADEIFGIPKNWNITVSAQTAAAQKAISRVQQALGKVKSKNIHIGVYYTSKGDLKLPGGTQIKGSSTGGPVAGPGAKGRDSVLRMLAPGEHVLSASDVDAMGGQGAVTKFRRALHGPGSAQAMAATATPWSTVASPPNITISPTIQLAGSTSPVMQVFAQLFGAALSGGQIRLSVQNGRVVMG